MTDECHICGREVPHVPETRPMCRDCEPEPETDPPVPMEWTESYRHEMRCAGRAHLLGET